MHGFVFLGLNLDEKMIQDDGEMENMTSFH